MPIWPTTTKAKAALFNKYGRGIIHMGLHEGVDEFVFDMGGRRRRGRPRKHINVLELTMNLDSIEAAIDLAPVHMVSVVVKGQGSGVVNSWNGTGDDWYLLPFMIIVGDFGPVVLVDARSSLSSTLATARYQFAIAVDGVIDKTSAIRYRRATTGNTSGPTIKTVVYPGPGQHTFQLACVNESVTTGQTILRQTRMRLTGLVERSRE